MQSIQFLLEKYKVVGAVASISWGQESTQTLCFGDAIQGRLAVGPTTVFEVASLSKSVASCFALEYFKTKGLPLSTSLNQLLQTTRSPFRIQSSDPQHPEWSDQVTLAHLISHSALNMHYVNGIPLSSNMPSAGDLLMEPNRYGYEPVRVNRPPGSTFQYSGGGFLVLEHLLESLENRRIAEIMDPFCKKLGMRDFTFDQKSLCEAAHGYQEDGKPVVEGRKMHPALAAGGLGSARDLIDFSKELTCAYQDLHSISPISHDTAVRMLAGTDLGSLDFMGARMGLGIFVAQAGSNRLAIHQGANEGFRSLLIYCFRGPDLHKGFVILCNGENNGVLFIAEAAQTILKEMRMEGIRTESFQSIFNPKGIPQEETVNQGYKELIFQAFEPDLPEIIERSSPHHLQDPCSTWNLAIGSKILGVSNQQFGRAENLISPYLPTFDPELFGRQGKVMDSWETARHNPRPSDFLTLELRKPSPIGYVCFSTQFHLGNQPESVRLEGMTIENSEWKEIVPRIPLRGHALKKVKSVDPQTIWKQVRVSIFPDGGLSRLGIFGEDLPEDEKVQYLSPMAANDIVFVDPIPKPIKPLVPIYSFSPEEVEKRWQQLANKNFPESVDAACSAWGGRIVRVSNEHYGPAAQILSPFAPLHMFDGFESARSRDPEHYEEIVIELGRSVLIDRIEIDFKFFINNNPSEISIEGASAQNQWNTLVPRTSVKAYAGNSIQFLTNPDQAFRWIKVFVFPDGGFNRLHVFGRTTSKAAGSKIL